MRKEKYGNEEKVSKFSRAVKGSKTDENKKAYGQSRGEKR